MKKVIIALLIVIAVILIAVGIFYLVSPTKVWQTYRDLKEKLFVCEDGDGGKDFYKMGSARGFYNKQKTKQGEVDICTLNGSRVESCVLGDKKIGEQGCRVMEMYCQDKELEYEYFECPNGCKNGACIK